MASGTAMSQQLERALLNAVFRRIAYTSPQAVYVGLFDSSGAEVSRAGYRRQEVPFSEPDEEDRSISNPADVLFDVADEDWGTVGEFGLFDAPQGGNMIAFGPLTIPTPGAEAVPYPRDIGAGDQFVFRAGQISVRFE